jgi:outer membrane biosynthesis protein TonB
MRKVIILMFIIGSWNILISQEGSTQDWSKEDQRTFESATELFNKRYYESAYEKYVSLTPNHADDMFLKFVRGVCGVYINGKHKEAEKLLTEVKKNDPRAEGIDYYLALLYHKSYRFDKALELTASLLSNPSLTKEDKIDLERIAFYSRNGKNEIQYPLECLIENLGSPLNSEYAEYGPVITPDEESMIFTYRGKMSTGGLVDANNKPDKYGDYNEDILISKKVNGAWQKPEHLPGLNDVGNDAVIALSPDGNELFIFKTEGDNGEIYVCKREGDAYGKPEKLNSSINSPYWEGSLSISTDQKKLYFASSRPGGFGGKDLYVASKGEDGAWGNVKNLGDKINTEYDEDAPFISPDSRVLIFSSDGHNSIGDFDLFISELSMTDNSWKTPKNLGYPINTTDDDLFYGLSPDGKRGYFSSAREGGKGDQDIYVVEPALNIRNSYVAMVKGTVTYNKVPAEVEIEVSYANATKHYGIYKSNVISGNYMLNLPLGEKYKLTFKHKTAGSKTYQVSTLDVSEYAEKIINLNFKDGEVAKTEKPNVVAITNKDTVSFVKKSTAVATNPKTEKTETVTANEKSEKTEITKEKSIDEKTLASVNKSEKSEKVEKEKTKSAKEKIEKAPTEEVTLIPDTKTEKAKSKSKKEKVEKAVTEEATLVSNTKTEKTLVTLKNTSRCDKIKTNYDADFIYRKCDGVWYTKSKTHAYSKYARGFFKEWTSLADNPKANEKLNQRYLTK